MDRLWLPAGQHWGLTITHHPCPDAGDFIAAPAKTTWHTAEGTNLDATIQTLIAKGAESHLVVSVDAKHVVQLIPFNRCAKSLMHPPGTPETNRAHCIQIEVCGYARDSGNWATDKYRRLAALATLIEHRCNVERATHVSWAHPQRIPADRFAGVGGHIGHMHVPNNDHVDPGTGFKIQELFTLMGEAEKQFG